MEGRNRGVYTKEFKLEMIHLSNEKSQIVKQIASNLGIGRGGDAKAIAL